MMDLQSIYSSLSEMSPEEINGRISFYLIRYKNGNPLIYKPEIQQEVQVELVNLFLDDFKKEKRREIQQEDYDF
ncbi:TPA: hypothetical protein OK954_003179, partial [Listeria monocytogenes]|nr:hypothetical protein [Listeria monocytogenes]